MIKTLDWRGHIQRIEAACISFLAVVRRDEINLQR